MTDQNATPALLAVDWSCIIRAVLKRWNVIVLIAALSAAAAYILSAELYTPRYTATTTYVVSERNELVNIYNNLDVASELAEAFTEILNSNILKEKVSEQTGLSMDGVAIDAALITGTNLLDLHVTAARPEDAFFILQALIEHHDIVTSKVMENAVLQTLRAPKIPVRPDEPCRNKEFAVRTGIITAIASAAVLGIISYLSDTVKNTDQALTLVDSKLLSVVYHERTGLKKLRKYKKAKRKLLLNHPSCGFYFSETFKNLRARTEHRLLEDGGKILLVTSAAKGEGKTTVASNLALAFAEKKKRVLLIDCNTNEPAIDSLFEIRRNKELRLRRYSLGLSKNELDETMLFDPKSGLFLLTTGKMSNAADFFLSESMQTLFKRFYSAFDHIIVDSPSVKEGIEAECLARICPHTLLVVRQDDEKAKHINDAIDIVASAGSKVIGFVFSNVKTSVFFGSTQQNDIYGYGYGYGDGYGGKYGKYGYGKTGYGRYGYHKEAGTKIDPETIE